MSTTSKLQNKTKLEQRHIIYLIRKNEVYHMWSAQMPFLSHTHIPQRSYLQKERTGDLRGNCSTRFPFYISFLWKSFYPKIALPGNPRRKSLTCLHMESNCPKTGPDPNKRGAKLSQMGLDSKTETRAIWITTKSPCNDQRWGNHVWLALFVFFDCWTNSRRAASLLCWSNKLDIFCFWQK